MFLERGANLESRAVHTHPKNTQVPPPVKRTPQESINEFIIQKVESVAIQIDPRILACVMSREFTREAVIKILPALFS